jgi:hypothetical protein
MKIALIERVKDKRRVEIRDVNESKLLDSFIKVSDFNHYNERVCVNSYGDKFIVTIVNY